MGDKQNYVYLTCRVILGVLFVLSAVLKFLSLDAFEVYLYGFDLVPLFVASLFSRCLLFGEFLLGFFLISGYYKRWTNWLTLSMLVGFSLFLFVLYLSDEKGNCHCMGETFSFSPGESLLKNGLMLLLLGLGSKAQGVLPFRKWGVGIIALSAFVFSFVLKAPYGFATPADAPYNQEALDKFVEELQLRDTISSGEHLMAFFSPKCKHCKMTIRKLNVCRKKVGKEAVSVHWYVWGNEEQLDAFVTEDKIQTAPVQFVTPNVLLEITKNHIPLLLFVREGKVVKSMSNPTFDEQFVLQFLNGEK